MPDISIRARSSILTTPQRRGEIILFEEKTSSFDEGIMPLYHGTPTLQHLLPPAGADSLEMIHAVVEQNRRRDRERIEVLEQEVAELREAVGLDRPAPRNVSKAQAKKEIRGYFAKHDGELIYPDDIADDLNLEMQQVIEICEALAEEGKIARKG